ncbi:MAG: histone deacetylase [Deltaproteobacteria bacterium]|nr:histone deacetylase [Deltaproteobacteria bacterium]
MPKTGIVRHPIYLKHDMGLGHPETPRRLLSIYDMLDEPDMAGRFAAIEPRPARPGEIQRIHAEPYYRRVEQTSGRSVYLDPDTSTSPQSFDAALMAAGGTIEAVDAVMDGRADNAFCLHRPPGHHAERDRAMGFCLFNNVAIGAAHALERADCRRVLIYDPDLHHGNGTQNSFYARSDVLYVSTHQYPLLSGNRRVQ